MSVAMVQIIQSVSGCLWQWSRYPSLYLDVCGNGPNNRVCLDACGSGLDILVWIWMSVAMVQIIQCVSGCLWQWVAMVQIIQSVSGCLWQ